ncbi:hypothetical protein GGX14DRAFT_484152, partial [Mycena pura]
CKDLPSGEPESQGQLKPVTSHGSGRYETSTFVETYVMDIPPGLFTTFKEPEPQYLPPGWSAHVHPEGNIYFALDGPLRVVTNAYLYRGTTLQRVCHWIEQIQKLLLQSGVTVTENAELFLMLEAEDCGYYLVDHATRTQFWLESFDTEKLDLPAVSTQSQLKIVLEELYWVHVEHFPMHVKPLPTEILDDIIYIFSHGLCDQMTSHVSTFNFSARECEVFLNLLQRCRGNINSGHTTWIIARLWSILDAHKVLIHHGQEQARLSRDQYIVFNPELKHRWLSLIMALITFKTSGHHLARLNDVFVDHIVYIHQWKPFISDCLQQWRSTTYVVSNSASTCESAGPTFCRHSQDSCAYPLVLRSSSFFTVQPGCTSPSWC